MIHIYCGDGKGKTTAAVGLAVRAAGCGRNVLFVRFLKDLRSGEIAVLEQLSRVKLLHPQKTFGFFHTLTEEEQENCRRTYAQLWREAQEQGRNGGFDVLVLDEFMAAARYGMISQGEALAFLQEQRNRLEIVLTGRDPGPEIMALADYISEVRKIRHPFDQGILAREGIEY